MRIHGESLLLSAVLTACSSTPTQPATSTSPGERLASSTSFTSWEAGAFRRLASMPQPDGYDLDVFVGDTGLFPHTSSYNPTTSLRFGKVKTLLEAVLSASSASLADGTRGNWCAVRSKAAAAGYQVRRFYDTESGRYLVFGRDSASGGQQAYFFLNPAYQRDLVLEAPHDPVDPGTAVEAARLFRALGARALIVNGSDRCASSIVTSCDGTTPTCGGVYHLSDVAHHPANAFEALHEAFDAHGARFAQIHVMGLPNKVVVDDGTTNDSDVNAASVNFVAHLKRVIDPDGNTSLDDPVCACQTPNQTPAFNTRTKANGCFSTNVQARYTHLQADPSVGSFNMCNQGSQYGTDRRMLLIEQAATMTDGDCSDGYCWSRLAQALGETWPCGNGASSCTWGSRQSRYADKSCP